MNRVRVLVVDDSPTMRGAITTYLSSDPEIDVVGSACDAIEARTAIKTLNPDVITLDVMMPRMNGIEFLERIMRLRPMPVVMVSMLTQADAAISIEALEIGAVDCVGKPNFEGLADKVKAASRARVRARVARPAPGARLRDYRPSNMLLAVGASTGGVEALLTMLSGFPENCPATVITQHMPASFTTSFAARLDRVCAPRVEEASDGAPLTPGRVYITPGGPLHLEVVGGAQPHCKLLDAPAVGGHRPSVDVLFASVAHAFGARATGVILTGMGRDGAVGLKQMRDAGARTLGQDEATSVVYGMPKAAFELGAVERQTPLSGIGAAALDFCALEKG